MEGFLNASDIRAYISGDPIIDWLRLHGAAHGYAPDTFAETYLEQCDFLKFIRRKGQEFETAIIDLLGRQVQITHIVDQDLGSSDPAAARYTLGCMKRGDECIVQGVFHDHDLRVIGVPDLLIRSDVLARLFPQFISPDHACTPAPVLDQPFHYRAIDVKFTTLELNAAGELGNNGSQEFYKAQLALYNFMLAKVQGYDPARGYLLGRGWRNSKDRGSSALDKLGVVSFPQPQHKAPDRDWTAEALDALQWLRDVETHGANWSPLPNPTRPELRPDMSNQNDAPWRGAKKKIAEEQRELTLLWQVGAGKRDEANRAGITQYTDPRCTAQQLGLKGDQARILDAILDANLRPGPVIRPEQITAGRDEWLEPHPMEFFVDFETVSDLDDDMSRLPEKGGYPGIFMVGCGHIEDGQWQFRCFVADPFNEEGERAIIDEWLRHMTETTRRLAPKCEQPRLYHWSYAEVSQAEAAYNSAFKRLNEERLLNLQWYDLWKNVFRAEPVTVQGAWGFGLKAVAKNLRRHGLIETEWADGPTDGLGAMAGAWWCYSQAAEQGRPVMGVTIPETDRRLMVEIQDYNEVDCRVMVEILSLLRASQISG